MSHTLQGELEGWQEVLSGFCQMLWGFCPVSLVYCSAVWCSAADTHLQLLDRAVSCARFLTGVVKVYRLGVKPILRSDEEKELPVTSARGQRKLVVKNFSQTFVKNAFYFLRILVL